MCDVGLSKSPHWKACHLSAWTWVWGRVGVRILNVGPGLGESHPGWLLAGWAEIKAHSLRLIDPVQVAPAFCARWSALGVDLALACLAGWWAGFPRPPGSALLAPGDIYVYNKVLYYFNFNEILRNIRTVFVFFLEI